MEKISLQYEVRDDKVYIYGSWHLGEIRASFSELGNFIPESSYRKMNETEEQICRSCRYNADTLCILAIGAEEIPICTNCRKELCDTVREVKSDNSVAISSSII